MRDSVSGVVFLIKALRFIASLFKIVETKPSQLLSESIEYLRQLVATALRAV